MSEIMDNKYRVKAMPKIMELPTNVIADKFLKFPSVVINSNEKYGGQVKPIIENRNHIASSLLIAGR